MADKNNPGQFGNRADTEEQAQKGGKASHGGGRNTSDLDSGMSREEAGRKGAEARWQGDSENSDE